VNWQGSGGEGGLSIGEVCGRTGLSARTVRYYEEQGLLPGVRRRAAGRRVYGGDELERLRFIQRLKALGLSLAEIRELNAVYGIGGSTEAMLARLDQLLARRLDDLDRRIHELGDLRDEIETYRAHVTRRARTLRVKGSGEALRGEAAR
jgi:MerR family transcriptional regulator, copper efflux regulator